MKKISITIIALLLIIIFLLLYRICRKKDCGNCSGKPVDSCRLFCTDYSNTELRGMIDFSDFVSMSSKYNEDPGKRFITAQPGEERRDDATSMVFGLKKIKTLIWQMENRACKYTCDSNVKLGIRFYYVKYPENVGTPGAPDCLDGISPDQKNKHALVMVPAYKKNNTALWYDYDLWSSLPKCFVQFPQLAPKGKKFVAVMEGDEGEGGDNHGGIGPPPGNGIFPTNN